MTRRTKWLLWTDAIVFLMLFLFSNDLALVLPAPPHREFMGMLWPPFFGENYLTVPDWSEQISVIGVLITGCVLIGFGLWAGWKRVKAASFRRLAAKDTGK